VRVYAVRDLSLDGSRLGDIIDVLLTRAAAERFIDDVRRDDRRLTASLRIVEVELMASFSTN
jgi:hypothetical protein